MSKQGVAKQDPSLKQFSLYNRGELNAILTKDLVNNEVAIKQLINEYNIKTREIQELREVEIELQSELDHQKTSPFYAIISAFFNIIGTIIVGYGINALASGAKSVFLVVLGGVLILGSNIQTICHRWVRQWFANSKSSSPKRHLRKENSLDDSLT